MTPISPQVFTWRFQLAGLVGSRSLACQKHERTSKSFPMRPLRAVSNTRCAPGRNGNSELQRTKRPDRCASAAIRSAAARSMPKGFSAKRSFPARNTSV